MDTRFTRTLSNPKTHRRTGTLKNMNDNGFAENTPDSPAPPNSMKINHDKLTQGDLFHVEKQTLVNGIEMGVLDNGIPYLTETGLAQMCGISRSVLYDIVNDWNNNKNTSRIQAIGQLLQESGYTAPTLYLKSEHNGNEVNAYTQPVCLALLYYYAHETKDKKEQAAKSHRLLANYGFQKFIYELVDYQPTHHKIDVWRHFHDRISLTKRDVPFGYFCVFHEAASIIVPMIESGLINNDKFLPDISIGRMWSTYWKSQKIEEKYGCRITFQHNYPDYYPQAASNPQEAWAYPNAALGAFREWLETTYIHQHYPEYLWRKYKQKQLGMSDVQRAISVFSPPGHLPRLS